MRTTTEPRVLPLGSLSELMVATKPPFERTSLVEAELRHDPAGAYARQDFATKDRYRRTVEQLARGSKWDELKIARRAVGPDRGLTDRGSPRGEHCSPAARGDPKTGRVAGG